MKSRKLTVGSLKTKEKVIPNYKAVENHTTFQFVNKSEKRKINRIEVMQNNRNYTIIAQKKSSLLDLALEQNQMLSFKCKKGSCGKCKVKILSGTSCLEDFTKQERKTLKDQLDLQYRLSCQAIVNDK
jgi:ferredoxin